MTLQKIWTLETWLIWICKSDKEDDGGRTDCSFWLRMIFIFLLVATQQPTWSVDVYWYLIKLIIFSWQCTNYFPRQCLNNFFVTMFWLIYNITIICFIHIFTTYYLYVPSQYCHTWTMSPWLHTIFPNATKLPYYFPTNAPRNGTPTQHPNCITQMEAPKHYSDPTHYCCVQM